MGIAEIKIDPSPGKTGPPLVPTITFAVGLLLFIKSEFFVAWDLSYYLAMAGNLLQGLGFVTSSGWLMPERPLFPLMLAGVLNLSHGSLLACGYLISLVSAGMAAMAVGLARRLFGNAVAVVCAVLILSSPSMIFWVPRHIDPFWPLALMAALFLLLARQKRRELCWGGLAGLVAGSALLIKEVSVLFIPAPLVLAWLGSLPGGWRRAAGFYGGLLPLAALWAFLFFIKTAAPHNPIPLYEFSLANLLAVGTDGLARYYLPVEGAVLFKHFGLAAAMLLALAGGVLGLRRRGAGQAGFNPFLVVLVTWACLLPLDAWTGYRSGRVAQNFLGITMLYLLLGAGLIQAAGWLARRLPGAWGKAIPAWALALVLTIGAAGVQVQWDSPHRSGIMSNTLVAGLLSGQSPKATLRGRDLYDWLSREAKGPCRVMIDETPPRNALSLLGDGRIVPEAMPFQGIMPIKKAQVYLAMDPLSRRLAGPVMITTGRMRGIGHRSNILFAISRDELLRAIKTSRVRYVVLFRSNRLLARWLQEQPGIRLAGRIRDSRRYKVSIFEVAPDFAPGPGDGPDHLFLSRHAVAYFRWLKAHSPDLWAKVSRLTVEYINGLDPSRLNMIINGTAAPCYSVFRP